MDTKHHSSNIYETHCRLLAKSVCKYKCDDVQGMMTVHYSLVINLEVATYISALQNADGDKMLIDS